MGLEARILARRSGFGSRDWDLSLEPGGKGGKRTEKEEKEKEKEKIPHMCESIGHRPLQGRCPKASFCFAELFFLASY